MTFKELNAAMMVVSSIGIGAWVAWQAVSAPLANAESVAWRLLYAIGFTILINIGLMIVATIVVSIAQREELKDEQADERDRMVSDRSQRNGYFVTSVGGLGVLIGLAMGWDAGTAAYALFGVLLLGGAADPVSRLVYYRIG